MPLLLDIPYKDKEEAKQLGAWWNPEFKKWYAPRKADYPKFAKWFISDSFCTDIICDYIYIVIGERECFKCHKTTEVICFGIENYLNIAKNKLDDIDSFPFEYFSDSGILISSLFAEILPKNFLSYLRCRYRYYLDYSKTINDVYYANHCLHCGSLQGNNLLFSMFVNDAPFFIDSKKKAENLVLKRVRLKYDLISNIDLGHLNMEENLNMAVSGFIEGFSTIVNSDLIF